MIISQIRFQGDHANVARVAGTPRSYIIWASPMRTYIVNTITSLRYTTFRVTHLASPKPGKYTTTIPTHVREHGDNRDTYPSLFCLNLVYCRIQLSSFDDTNYAINYTSLR